MMAARKTFTEADDFYIKANITKEPAELAKALGKTPAQVGKRVAELFALGKLVGAVPPPSPSTSVAVPTHSVLDGRYPTIEDLAKESGRAVAPADDSRYFAPCNAKNVPWKA